MQAQDKIVHYFTRKNMSQQKLISKLLWSSLIHGFDESEARIGLVRGRSSNAWGAGPHCTSPIHNGSIFPHKGCTCRTGCKSRRCRCFDRAVVLDDHGLCEEVRMYSSWTFLSPHILLCCLQYRWCWSLHTLNTNCYHLQIHAYGHQCVFHLQLMKYSLKELVQLKWLWTIATINQASK